MQHIPILRENWVISLHGRLESAMDDDDQVPYFLLPSLGSGSTLRGYSSWRFRDRHAVLASAEWRWILNRMALDLAVFADTGMVAPRFDALSTSQFVSDYRHRRALPRAGAHAAAGRVRPRPRGHCGVVFSASAAF